MEKKIINGTEYIGYPVGNGRMVYVMVEDLDKLAEVKAKNEDFWFHYQVACFDADGNRIMGIWKHGRSGTKRYTEPMLFNLATNDFVRVRDYHNGQIRHCREFNCRVIWN